MNKQLIISIGREYGSGGHEVARKLAAKLDIPFYDRNLLDEVAQNKDADVEELSQYDEAPHKPFFSRTVRGFSNSPAVNVAELQFALLKSKAADEDSFVVVGRCADELFRNEKNAISFFIYSDHDEKIKRIVEHLNISEKDALKKMERHDKSRRAYHDYFSSYKWGETKTYDLCLNSSKLGIDGTVDFLYEYIKMYYSL
ncbi:cytidylate kinase-like family protein [Treponema sp.]|uniref:cytidylate kinase-like family protein n=1 Tax=Treponema sp. TaxID=166 RepID=UPI00298DBD23|nr:cytidylate kinase-like family protein [Treponema sp.]MCR5613308.1 cytidylate kinase-like family protein [Treponema sp.]